MSKLFVLLIATGLLTANIHAQTFSGNGSSRKDVVIKMNQLFNENKPELAMTYYADSLQKAGINGKSFILVMNDDILNTFPDVQTKILEIWEDGDWVIARCQFSGTHKGIAKMPHHGGLLVGKPPTNKSFSVQHIRMYKVVDGKITARQAVRDDLLMYQQLGIIESGPKFQPNAADKKTN